MGRPLDWFFRALKRRLGDSASPEGLIASFRDVRSARAGPLGMGPSRRCGAQVRFGLLTLYLLAEGYRIGSLKPRSVGRLASSAVRFFTDVDSRICLAIRSHLPDSAAMHI